MASLRDKTISGIFWSFLQQAGGRGISFLITIILARLLSPQDFGLIAILMIFIQISQTLVNGGFSLALIQKKEVDDEDYSSVFYINLVVSCAAYMIIYVTAPFIAVFYNQPILTLLLRILSLVFIINAFSYVQEAHLNKDLRFKTLMFIHLPSNIFGGAVSIGMAMLGFGVWSIVALQLVTRLAYAIQIWIYSKWKPLFSFNKHKAKNLFSFGYKLMISDIIHTIYTNIYIVIIGKFFPVSTVGYYQTAYTMVDAPSSTITGVLSGVTFPIFASIQDDTNKLKEGYRSIMQQVFFWICPAFLLAGFLATPMFRFIFTDKWLPAVPYFQWLCVVGVFAPLIIYNLNIVNVIGRSDVFLKLELIRKAVSIIAIIIVIPYGIKALLIVQAASIIFTYFLFSFFAGRFIQYTMREQLQDIFPTLLLSFVIGVLVLVIDHYIMYLSDLIRLVIGFVTGGILYLSVAKLFKFSPLRDFKNVFQNKILQKLPSRN